MGEAARDIRGRFTWADYQTWPDDERWEIVGGEAHAMAPAPTTRHQRILCELSEAMNAHCRGRECTVFPAPTDLHLTDGDVVQPDLMAVCDRSQIRDTHIEGAPTLVVEILSPSTAAWDQTKKMDLYARSGVQEVWIVTPYPPVVQVFLLAGARYQLAGSFAMNDPFKSPTFPELELDLMKVFDFPVSEEEKKWMVREPQTPPYAATRKQGEDE